jgi:hypothetical protein
MHFPSFITFHKLFWLYSEILDKINNIEVHPGQKTISRQTPSSFSFIYFVHPSLFLYHYHKQSLFVIFIIGSNFSAPKNLDS